jgi:hypothetical protein
VFFSMTVAAAEVAVGLAIVIAVYRLRHSTDVDDATDLHEVDYGPVPPLVVEGADPHHDDHDHGDAAEGDDDGGDGDGGDDAPAPETAEPVGAAGGA